MITDSFKQCGITTTDINKLNSPLRNVLQKNLEHTTYIDSGPATEGIGFDSFSDQELCLESEPESEFSDNISEYSDDSSLSIDSSSEEYSSDESSQSKFDIVDESNDEDSSEDEDLFDDSEFDDDPSMDTDFDEESSMDTESSDEDLPNLKTSNEVSGSDSSISTIVLSSSSSDDEFESICKKNIEKFNIKVEKDESLANLQGEIDENSDQPCTSRESANRGRGRGRGRGSGRGRGRGGPVKRIGDN